jgi:hypothetical protein
LVSSQNRSALSGSGLTAPNRRPTTDNGAVDGPGGVGSQTGHLKCDAQNGFFAGGNGDFSVMLDGAEQYLYPSSAPTLVTWPNKVAVVRMAWSDRDAPVGNVWNGMAAIGSSRACGM